MRPNDQVLTVAQMGAAEQALIDGGETVSSLMRTAGRGAAEWVWRLAAGRVVTVLCGPGNNGGDGYVIAETLRARGAAVTVVAPFEPRTEAARQARSDFGGDIADQGRGGVFVDCLFGSGLTRPLGPELANLVSQLARAHQVAVAIDLPSGIDSDRGTLLDEGLPRYDLTVALGAWKFAHWRMPAMPRMGHRVLVDIGIRPVAEAARAVGRPALRAPAPDAHKYTRGLLLVVGGSMEGAAVLACEAAMRGGSGAVRLAAAAMPDGASPDLVLRSDPLPSLLGDDRTGAVLIGPGLGRDSAACGKLAEVLSSPRPAVVDADALHLVDHEAFARSAAPKVLTPHGGELAQLAKCFGVSEPDKVALARTIARQSGAVVVAKGPDTAIAAPDGRLALAASATSWLSVAGTGDVLAGVIASRLAAGEDPFVAACQGVWLHNEAARLCRPPFLASELARAVSEAYAACL